MSDQIGKEVESPAFFEPPQRPKGIARINWRLLGIAAGIAVVLFGIPVAYTYYDRFNPSYAGTGEEEETKVPNVAVSPIKRPPVEEAVRPMPVLLDATGAPVAPGLTEEERRWREKKRADLEAAIAAKPQVYKREENGNRMAQSTMMPGVNGLIPIPPPRVPGDEDDGDPNRQAEKRAFLNARDDESPYLKHTRMAPLGATELKAGSVIPIVTIGGMISDLPGMVTAQVRANVYDTATGRFILIPAGAKVYGISDSTVSAGQTRIMTAWQRIVFPDGSSVILDRMPGVDRSGYSGMEDQVDNHYLRAFGQAALIGLFMAGSQYGVSGGSANGNFNYAQILGASIGMQGFNLGSQVIRRNLNIQPTLIVRPGSLANIAVTKDIVLPPWQGHPLAQVAQ